MPSVAGLEERARSGISMKMHRELSTETVFGVVLASNITNENDKAVENRSVLGRV